MSPRCPHRLALASIAVVVAATGPLAAQDAADPYRPVFHYSARRHWLNDPNAPLWHDGRFMLHYQYNPRGAEWGHMSWGRATSVDLVRWTEQPVAIPYTAGSFVFSGSAVRDGRGARSLCGARDCLVAFFTAFTPAARPPAGTQSQHAATSVDGGQTWRRWPGNPVLDIGASEFRDPWVWRDTARGAWVMAVAHATAHRIAFHRSRDLVRWTPLSSFGPTGASGGVWECPVLLRLPVEGTTERRWVLKVDLNPGHPAGGSGAQYWVGDWDGRVFRPLPGTGARWIDGGPDFYCAMPWTDGPRARLGGTAAWIAWMSDWRYAARTPTGAWRGAMTVARSLALRRRGATYTLVQRPVPALATLRGARRRTVFGRGTIADPTPLPALRGDAMELLLHLRPGRAGEIGLLVRRDAGAHVLVAYDAARRRLVLDRRPAGGAALHPDFPGRYEVPLAPVRGLVTLRVLVDRSSVEVFGDDGAAVLTALAFPPPTATGIALFTKGGPIESLVLDAWPLGGAR